jgi:Mg2+/Co2+ transporter CorB
MSDIPLWVAFIMLVALVGLSAFFSGSETGMMALNRYRLRHLNAQGHTGAKRASKLLDRPDRLIGLILLGNNFVNIAASSLATLIALDLWGKTGVPIAAAALTVVILIFAEVAPKTVAAAQPERVAFAASLVLLPLLRALYPAVAAINWVANGLLSLVGLSVRDADRDRLSAAELRTVVNAADVHISRRHRSMLVGILDLESVTVDDIMVPRAEVRGIDLEDSERSIGDMLLHAQHTRIPVYSGDIDNVRGMLHIRKVIHSLRNDELTHETILAACDEPYFIPSGTPLNTQLFNFQGRSERVGLVVDEYGDIEGLATLEDILEEIVGEFTTAPDDLSEDVHPQDDGSFLVDGSTSIRELNRTMRWELPTEGPRTLNGLILEHLEAIPQTGTSLRVAGYPIEIVQTRDNAVKTAKIIPALRIPTGPAPDAEEEP